MQQVRRWATLQALLLGIGMVVVLMYSGLPWWCWWIAVPWTVAVQGLLVRFIVAWTYRQKKEQREA